jgi:hypothetical protein
VHSLLKGIARVHSSFLIHSVADSRVAATLVSPSNTYKHTRAFLRKKRDKSYSHNVSFIPSRAFEWVCKPKA